MSPPPPTIGVYIDGPNIDISLRDAGQIHIQLVLGSLLTAHANSRGKLVECAAFVDEGNHWEYNATEDDLEGNGFAFVQTPVWVYREDGEEKRKSLTDPAMYCHIMDRLHDENCPDIFLIVSGDKDISICLRYIYEHGKIAIVVAETTSLADYLVEYCEHLRFELNYIEIVYRTQQGER